MITDKFDPDIPEHFRGDFIFAGFTKEGSSEPGYMNVRGTHFTAEDLSQPLRHDPDRALEIRSLIRGLSEIAVSIIQVVLSNSHENDVTSRENMLNLLYFRAVPFAQQTVRRALAEIVPRLVVKQFRSPKELPMIKGIFDLYARIKDDPECFTRAANQMTADMDINRLSTTLAMFHTILRTQQAKLTDQISHGN